MKYLFDSSAVFCAIKQNKIELLNGNYTVELARYELGNIIWKDLVLHAKVSKQETQMIAKAIKHTLTIMEVLQIAGKEGEILETAAEHKITFYDASYAYCARENQLQLITEDLRLIKKISLTITALTLKDIK